MEVDDVDEEVDELEEDEAPSGGKRKRIAGDKKDTKKKAKTDKKAKVGVRTSSEMAHILTQIVCCCCA
jgi:hypothetical protein